MKTLFKNLTKFVAVLALVLFAGTAMAASFDSDPAASDNYGNNTGFTSINTFHSNGDNLKNQLTNVSNTIPNYGDYMDFYVFVDFKTQSGLITNPNARIQAPLGTGTSSTATFTGRLSGSNASLKTDTTSLTGLPDEYEIVFKDGWNYVDERTLSNGLTCTETYSGISFEYYYDDISSGELSSGFILPNDLDYQYAQGWCDQGFVVAKYRVTNKTQDAGGDDIQVTTTYVNVNNDDVVFHGTLNTGTATTWFVYGPSGNNLSCNGSLATFVEGPYTGSHNYDANVNNLSPGSYHYMACAMDNGTTVNGSTVPFQIQNVNNTYEWSYGSWGSWSSWGSCSNGEEERTRTRSAICVNINTNTTVDSSNCSNGPITHDSETRSCDDGGSSNGDRPDAETRTEGEVTATTGNLRGKIRMNSFNDGLVFFVYDTNEGDIDDVLDSIDNFDEIYDVSTEVVSNSNGVNDWKNFNYVAHDLNTNDRYYYKICVEYYDDEEEIVCGNTEQFRTDGDNDDDNYNVHIYTQGVTNVTKTSAKICGSLTNNGDSSIQRWLQLRRATNSSFNTTDDGKHTDSNGGEYCDTVTGLSPNTKYYYRACRTVNTCGVEKYFTTDSNGTVPSGDAPEVTTNDVPLYSIRANSALLPGTFVSHADTARVWFNYGYSPTNLNRTTTSSTKYGTGGAYNHSFTNLKSNQRYCYQAVVQTVNGKKVGAVKCFYTLPKTTVTVTNPNPVVPTPQPVVTVIEDVEPDIDLSRLGLGLSLIRLEINDNKEQVTNGENITYEITWENISRIDLDDLDLNISIPREVQIISSSRGQLDQDLNSVFYTINNLDAGERGSMTVNGIVNNGQLGDALTADATIAFDNPINDAQENAQDYDFDEFVILTAVGTASVFGLANITLLGWLTILLGLFIIFLVARWLYLEREELRAQAYVNGYGRAPQYVAPANNHNGYVSAAPQYVAPVESAPRYVEAVVPQQTVQHVPEQIIAPTQSAPRTDYTPYRPNR